MTLINHNVLERAKTFIYSHARLLDRMRFAYLFENGSKDRVVAALRVYQNEDGGFGHALEPDMRCPDSQPVTTEMGLHILQEVGGFDSDLMDGVLTYLKTITLEDGGLPRATTQVNAYPHAPWWNTEKDGIPSLNPTGIIIGILLEQTQRSDFIKESWFQSHISFLWRSLEHNQVPKEYHDALQWISFLEHVDEKSERRVAYREVLDQWLSGPHGIEKDEHAEGYVHKVLDYAPTPNCYASRLVTEEEVTRHLEWLISTQQEDGGWSITFPAVSPAGEQEWRGWLTIERLKVLKAYGVI